MTILTMTRQEEERAHLFATTRHTFTLTFAGGQVALLDVRGAADQKEAHTIACTAIRQCRYVVTEGDVTGGHAHCLYHWCTAQAQERNLRLGTTTHSHKEEAKK